MANRIVPPRTKDDREIRKFFGNVCDLLNALISVAQVDSTAANVSDLKDDFNSLLAKLRSAGLMEE